MDEKEKRKRKEIENEKKERKKRKIKEERKKIRAWERSKKGKERKRERASRALSDSQCPDGQKSIGQELKLVYLPRATSRCKKQKTKNKKQKQKEVGFSPTLVPPNLRVINGSVVQPQPWD